MKKSLFITILILSICSVHAQFGVQVGASFYSGKATEDNISIKYDTKVGFTAGLIYNFPISSSFNFMPSLNFTQKGGKINISDFDSTELLNGKDNLTLNYIELPLNFVYNVNGFFIGAGPDLAYGISGKEKSTFDSQTENKKIHFGGSSDDDFKPFEFSANILAGYKLRNGLFITANYNPGISNIAPKNTNAKWHNNGFNIRVGYMFGGSKKPTAQSDDKQ